MLLMLLAVSLAGFIGQMVDGSLGMGYGVTSTSVLLAVGLTPAIASASVHLAEIGTSLASGASHWRYGNVDRGVLLRLAIPGGVGAFVGAVVLSNLSLDVARPWVSLVLLVLGGVILIRFVRGRGSPPVARRPRAAMLIPLGLVGGFLDASGGGGWGPVTTSTLTASKRLEPRRAIGTASASEFVVSVAASVGFLVALGQAGVRWDIAGAMLVGGVVAAPLAAALVQRFDQNALGAAIGVTIVVLNVDRVIGVIGIDPAVGLLTRLSAVVVGLVIVSFLLLRGRDTQPRGATAAAGS
jgi:uncharacterized protein